MSEKHSIRTDYEDLASGYDARYLLLAEQEQRGRALIALAHEVNARQVLEVGCGTGHWLEGIARSQARAFGLDLSEGMLRKAQAHTNSLVLTRGSALDLPYASGSFDMIYCVDALHHFGDPRRYLERAFRVLRSGGALAVIGNDPHSGEVSWYGYDFFPGVLETDLERFTAYTQLMVWMREIGYGDVRIIVLENLEQNHHGREVFTDPFLEKRSCSQYALLSDEAYQQGLRNIEKAVKQAEAGSSKVVFRTCWPVLMLRGTKP